MILVTGGTGASGRPIVDALARAGAPFLILARDPAKVTPPAGARVVRGDLADPASLDAALASAADVETVFLNSGPTEDLIGLQTNMIRAAARAGVGRVVKLSVLGADLPQARQAIRFADQHGQVEDALEDSGLAWTMLRPTFFMQNLLGSASTLRADGAIYMPAGEGKAPYLDTRDLADVAAAVLTQPAAAHAGKGYALTGPEDLSFADMATAIARATGRPVRYVPVSEEQARRSLAGAGLPPFNVEGILDLMRATRQGRMAGVTHDVMRLAGHPARTFDAWARENAGAFA